MPKSKNRIRLILADDHNIVRAGVRQLLDSADDLQVVAEAEDGEQAQALIEKHKPDVAVLDIRMPGMSGIDACRPIVQKRWRRPSPKGAGRTISRYRSRSRVDSACR